jgi:ribonuclease III
MPGSRAPDVDGSAPAAPTGPVDTAALGAVVGHQFADPALLAQAMAHRSWCAEHPGHASNERLEFLGDAVLGWVVADLCYRRHRDLPEGKLTDLRKSVVNATALAAVARSLGLGEHLLLGKGERAAGGRDKDSILSDALEAVIGAVYLDGGVDAAEAFVGRLMSEPMDRAVRQLDRLDFKTLLQELTARLYDLAPVYVVSESGPDHAKTFSAQVMVSGRSVGSGVGRSKKIAEQLAAEAAHGLLAAEA